MTPTHRTMNGIRCRIASSLDGIDVPVAAAKKSQKDLIAIVVGELAKKHNLSQSTAESIVETLQPSTVQELLDAPTSAQPAQQPTKPSSGWASPKANASGVPKPINLAEVIRTKESGVPLRKALLERKDK